jgi:hypothetical protein
MRTYGGLCLASVLAACAFEPAPLTGAPGPPSSPDASTPDVTPDASAPGVTPDAAADAAAPADAGSPAGAFCDANDPALVGCFRFEDTVSDGSGTGLEVDVSGVSFDQGVNGRAAVITTASALHLAENPILDFSAFTIEMWVRPDALPVGEDRAALFDNESQYSVFIFDGATVRCAGSGEARQGGVLTVGAWTHVACVHDGQRITLFIDGEIRAAGNASPPDTDGSDGSNIAGNSPDGSDDFLGRIDDLRLWDRARTPDEVCAAAGCDMP